MKSKNSKTLDSFIQYCIAHPEERFWQALRNWSDHAFIFTSELLLPILPGVDNDANRTYFIDQLRDTFYKEGK